jgi:type IX secretion system PorP/SprF family membrane protein
MSIKNSVCVALRNFFLTVLFYSIFVIPSKAQQMFTNAQYMNNGIPYNASYSLINKSSEITLLGKTQWVGIDGAPKSFLMNSGLQFEQIKASAGLIFKQDKYGLDNLTSASAYFAKAVELTNGTFLASTAQIGVQSFTANYSQLDPLDPLFQNDINATSATIGMGIMLYNPDKFYFGASMPSLRLGQAKFATASPLYLSAGYLQALGKNITLKPSVLITYASKIPLTADISTTFYFGTLGLGTNYNTNNEVSGIISYLISNFKMGYSYQAAISNEVIGNKSNGSHEIMFGFYLGSRKTAKVQL